MTDKRKSGLPLGRRQFLGGAAGAVAATSFIGLPRAAGAQDIPKEAPMLAELVKQGKLPKLADRLPASPAVVTPIEGAGTYGGTWSMGTTGAGDYAWWWRTAGLRRPHPDRRRDRRRAAQRGGKLFGQAATAPSSPSSCARA